MRRAGAGVLDLRRLDAPTLLRSVLRFALTSLAVLLVVLVAGVVVLRRESEQEAIRDARAVTRLAAQGILAPALERGVFLGDERALLRLDRVVRERLLVESVVRVKLWTPDGQLIYSDDQVQIGRRFPLDPGQRAALRFGRADAEVADLSEPENDRERRWDKLLEVYLPVSASTGEVALFEAYLRYASVNASAREIVGRLLPLLVGVVLVLGLVQLPLAWSFVRRLDAGRRERERLLRTALDASDTERRRIAQHLHDGVVQSLAGVSFTLQTAADRAVGDDGLAAALREAAAGTRQGIRELRSLLVEVYPADLHRAGLDRALTDLLAALPARGIDAELRVPDHLELPPDTQTLFFRTTQEALRNVVAHSRAEHVLVQVGVDQDRAVLTVEDDGQGFVPADTAGREGHFGLRLMRDLAEEQGGRFEIKSRPGVGSRLRSEVPLP